MSHYSQEMFFPRTDKLAYLSSMPKMKIMKNFRQKFTSRVVAFENGKYFSREFRSEELRILKEFREN